MTGPVGGRLVVALLISLPFSSCDSGPPIPAEDLFLGIETEGAAVDLGRAFPLTVVRVWSKRLVPEEWSDEALAPLSVRLLATERREDDERIAETRNYHAWAFERGAVALTGARMQARPRTGGEPLVAEAAPLRLLVRGALDPDSAPAPELPEPLPLPTRRSSWLGWLAAAVTALLAAGALRLRTRRVAAVHPAPPVVPAVPEIGPDTVALERLAQLRAMAVGAEADVEAWYMAAAAALRDYVAARFTVPATARTTEEIVSAPAAGALAPGDRALLAGVLGRCDLVKFARSCPDADERETAVTEAEGFVRATGEPSQRTAIGGSTS